MQANIQIKRMTRYMSVCTNSKHKKFSSLIMTADVAGSSYNAIDTHSSNYKNCRGANKQKYAHDSS